MKGKDRPESLASSTAERLAAIVEAAERAAVTVIDDAEEQARRHLDQARAEAELAASSRLAALADLTDSLIAQAEAMRSQSERLLASLAETKRRIGEEGLAPAEAERPVRGSHLSAVAPTEPAPPEAPRIQPDPVQPDPAQSPAEELGTPAGARLLATQMAVSGNSREEIEARLRNGFEIEDTASILDAILGPED